ncbi:2Fe-2S iron-sulfur cluster-binding protein [Halobaculum magnesiiphilum]|uniref:2Fe-2S iron-sulfur cluster binding domain-containing protein n=1 Tax=Halobaculum magnesiiphilum TaxID=1017351 RepID=A0A8T8W973_9EURY|nr:2Fe-2S iron-sulfur cluster-binding protein [Halobaculum magnesiiphilum]QZP36380.1 2Fe-2S iron-sulfur cluster binding domain-containing protein [Halobaculum magnesiiphilum]
MVDPVAIGFGAGLVLVFVALHAARGTGWEATADISEEVIERRASTVEETEFPEPGSRAIGGGSAPAGAVATGEEGELEEGAAAEESSSGPGDIPEDEIEHFEVEFTKEGDTIEVANNETVLEAGEDEGWDMPYACREGQCVSCAGQITSGGNAEDYVEHDNQQMLDDAELDEGYTLTCVAYPRADFTIETGEAP